MAEEVDVQRYVETTVRELAVALYSVQQSRGFPQDSHYLIDSSKVYGVYMSGGQIKEILRALDKARALLGNGSSRLQG